MDDSRAESPAPEPAADLPAFELTAAPAGEDALQLGPADAASADAPADGPFAMHLADVKPDEPAGPAPLARPAKPVTAAANNSVVAALMGRPIAKTAKTDSLAPAAAPAVSATPESHAPTDVARPRPVKSESQVSRLDPPPGTAGLGGPKAVENAAPTSARTDPTNSESQAPSDDAPPGTARFSGPERFDNPDPRPAEAGRAEHVVAIRPTNPTPARPTPVDHSPTAATPSFESRAVASTPVAPASPPASAATSPTAVRMTPRQPAASQASAPRRAVPVAPAWPTVAPIPAPPAARPATPVSAVPEFASPAAASDTIDIDPAELLPDDGPTGAWWTIPLTFVGIAIVACAILIPAADENRRDGYELAKIERDVEHFGRQSDVNADFLRRVDTDPTLAERLALRQLHQTRVGVALAPLAAVPDRFGASPYALTRVDPPAPLPPYTPTPGRLGEWFLGGKNPQQMAGLGLLVAGAGVLIGGRRNPAIPADG